MIDTFYLSDNELAEITGYTRRADQIGWLTRNKWTFALSAVSKPVVSRRTAEGERMEAERCGDSAGLTLASAEACRGRRLEEIVRRRFQWKKKRTYLRLATLFGTGKVANTRLFAGAFSSR